MNPETRETDADGWQGLHPAARSLMFWGSLLPSAIPLIPVTVLSSALVPDGWRLAAIAVVALICLGFGAVLGRNRWRCTRWRLDEHGLRLRKGRWWRTEVFVPRSRVQHLDIHNGPLERARGLATLVIHTAGTQSHALKQGGFGLQTATMLRDALIPERRRDDSAL
ncbi:MAG: PH domain-containing protein [Arenimonas sp.]